MPSHRAAPSPLAIDLATVRRITLHRRILSPRRIKQAVVTALTPQSLALEVNLDADLARATASLAETACIRLLTKPPVNTYIPKPKPMTRDCLALLERAIQQADLTGIKLTDACAMIERELNHKMKPENLLLMLKRNREFHSLALYKDYLRLPPAVIVRRLAEMHVAARFGGGDSARGRSTNNRGA